MDFADLFFSWIVPVGVFSGAVALAGIRFGLVAWVLAYFVVDSAATDLLLLDTAWADERLVDDPTATITWVLAAVALVEVAAALVPLADRILSWLRVPGAAALGAGLAGVDVWTAVAGAAVGLMVALLAAQTGQRLLEGSVRAGGHPLLLSLMLTVSVAALSAVTVLVPLAGFVVIALLLRMRRRLRQRDDERHSGLRILAG